MPTAMPSGSSPSWPRYTTWMKRSVALIGIGSLLKSNVIGMLVVPFKLVEVIAAGFDTEIS
jgi:hypothetical protein